MPREAPIKNQAEYHAEDRRLDVVHAPVNDPVRDRTGTHAAHAGKAAHAAQAGKAAHAAQAGPPTVASARCHPPQVSGAQADPHDGAHPGVAAIVDAQTLGEARRTMVRAFKAAGVPTPSLDARLLMADALGLSQIAVQTEDGAALTRQEAQWCAALAAKRLGGMPVSRVLGRRAFCELTLAITDAVLDPRPETELLVDVAVGAMGASERRTDQSAIDRPRLLDLGTGSGAILLALLQRIPHSLGLGVDVSHSALQIARKNARTHDLHHRAMWLCSSWCDAFDADPRDGASFAGGFDIIVSNPPYIRSGDLKGLDPAVVLHDPAVALDGGPDGLASYREVINGAARALSPGGTLVLELGHDQADAVGSLLGNHEGGRTFTNEQRFLDLAGHERCISAEKRA